MGNFGMWTKVKNELPEKKWDGYQMLVTAYDPGSKTSDVYATEDDLGGRWNKNKNKYWGIENIGLKVTAWMEFPDVCK